MNWYLDDLGRPIYDDARLRIKGYAFTKLFHKQSSGIGDRAANLDAFWEATAVLPTGNQRSPRGPCI